MTPRVNPCLEELEDANRSKAGELLAKEGPLRSRAQPGCCQPSACCHPACHFLSLSELPPCQACPLLRVTTVVVVVFLKVFVELHYFEILGRKILCKWKLKIKFWLEGIVRSIFWLGLEKIFFLLTLKIRTFCCSCHRFCFILKGVADNGETHPLFSVFHHDSCPRTWTHAVLCTVNSLFHIVLCPAAHRTQTF